MKTLSTLLATALLATSASAQFISGNKLHERITSGNHGNTMWALGYVTGVADAYNGTLFCIPSTVTVGQIKDITERSLIARPQDRHLPADLLVAFALVDVFPCRNGGGT